MIVEWWVLDIMCVCKELHLLLLQLVFWSWLLSFSSTCWAWVDVQWRPWQQCSITTAMLSWGACSTLRAKGLASFRLLRESLGVEIRLSRMANLQEYVLLELLLGFFSPYHVSSLYSSWQSVLQLIFILDFAWARCKIDFKNAYHAWCI